MKDWLKRGALATGLALGAAILVGGGSTQAQVLPSSDSTAGFLIFPKISVDVTADPTANRTDTLIQLTNTSTSLRRVHCFYIDADTWTPDNFTLELSPGEPLGWSVHDGIANLGTADIAGSGKIPGRGDHFLGELKCIEVNDVLVPVPVLANDLKGEATIFTVRGGAAAGEGSVDVRSYNAIGMQALNDSGSGAPASIGQQCSFGTNAGTTCVDDSACKGGGTCAVTMCLGSNGGPECPAADYASCPALLILNNFFENAIDPVNSKAITTRLTFVPCTENALDQSPDAQPVTRVQFLVFNEFEQRMSTATIVQCYKDTALWEIDAKSQDASIFNVSVQGTLVGQTRMRPVQVPSDTTVGHGLLAIAEEFHGPDASVAVNLNESGVLSGANFVRYLPTP